MEKTNITKWLLPFDTNYQPDMFVVGFQEIVPLTAKNVMQQKNQTQTQYWDDQIKKCLDEHTEFFQESEKYVQIRSQDLVGVFISIYIKRCLRPFVKEIAVSRVKFGYANMANKGACSIRFKYKDSSLAFASSHLDSGIGPGLDTNRRQQLETIIKNSFIYERGTNML